MRAMWKLPAITIRERRAQPGRRRMPEPMAMDAPDSVVQFHLGGATTSGMRAVYDLSARCLNRLIPEGGRLLDLGCGSGRALAYFTARRPDVTATGVDLATNMLDQAQALLAEEGLAERVRVVQGDITDLPAELEAGPWDAVSCVWTLHHLPDEGTLESALRQIASLRDRHGCAIWLFDFQRLRNAESMSALLRTLEPRMNERLRSDGIASEAAAFTYEELRSALERAGLGDLQGGRDRPIPWLQAHWGSSKEPRPDAAPSWRDIPLHGSARFDAARLRRGFSELPIR